MPTAQRILDIAEELLQTRGFNAFSYADIAAAMSITKASLHYHFPSKTELGTKLLSRYEETFLGAVEAISHATPDGGERIRRYVGLWLEELLANRMCMCGMLAAEFTTLAPPMREALRHFMEVHEAWLSRVLEEGRAKGELTFEGEARETAGLMIGALEGTMLLGRVHGEVSRFKEVIRRMLIRLNVTWPAEDQVSAKH